MKLIREILYKVDINRVFGNTSLSIEKVEFDSRLVTSSDMYVAINGVNVNGHDYISQAIENGANCIICLLYTSPSPRDRTRSRMPSSA